MIAWRWIKSHKAATALVVVLLTLVPVLPEYRIVDFAGRDEDAIRQLLCSRLPVDECHRYACSAAIEEQIRLSLKTYFRDKRPLIPGLFQRRKKAYVFDYADWKRAFTWHYRAYDSTRREVGKAYPPRIRGAPCPAEPNWDQILKQVPLDELQRLTEQRWREIEKSWGEFGK